MKFTNKRKKARQHWTTFSIKTVVSAITLKTECQRNSSPYRFYFQEFKNQERMRIHANGTYSIPYPMSTWWFEDSEDALAFKLRWEVI